MRKASYWLAAMVGLTLILSACSSEEDINPDNRNLKHITFTAGQSQTRTIIDSQDATQINWQAGETISILDGTSTTRCFKLTSEAGKPEGVFDGMAQEQEKDIYTAVYPYQEKGLVLDGNSVKGAWLDSVQTATAGTFDPKANLMMARTKSGDKILQFHNMTAFVKVTPQMDCEQITIVSADSTVALAGTMTLTLDENGKPSAKVTDNASHQVSLTGKIEAGKTYYIAIAPATLKEGIRMGITTADGKHYYKDASKLSAFKENKVLNLGSISTSKMNWLPYVTFSAKEAQEVTLKDAFGLQLPINMEYSTDYGKHWNTFSVNKNYAFGNSSRLMLRGDNPQGTAISNSDDFSKIEFSTFSFVNNQKVACSGDIRTLVKKDDYENARTQNVRYIALFNGCKQLTSAPELPATELEEKCYAWMFQNCTSLTQAPLLPAKTLTAHCYFSMFYGCASLTSVTMLAESGFNATECLHGWLAEAGTNGSILTVAAGKGSNETIKDENNTPNYWKIVEQ